MLDLGYELRRMCVKPAPMPAGTPMPEPTHAPVAVRVTRVFNAGSAEERKFAESMAIIATAFRNGLITEERARYLAERL